jgi:hypothetical protein
MLKQLKSTSVAGLLLLSVLAFSACDDRLLSDDYGPCPGSSSEAADSAALYLSFTMRVAGSGDTRADDGTWGGVYTTDETAYDAVINPEEVHVALFSETGEYLSEVQRITCSEITAGTYQYFGLLDAEQLTEGNSYRCMVVANAGDVDFTQLSTLTYQASDLPQGGDTHSFYIPMWGVQTFTLQKGNSEMKTIEMLRAAAKCRIHFSDEMLAKDSEIAIKNAKINICNHDGYVVPTGFNEVSRTEKLSYNDCYNPTTPLPSYVFPTDENGNITSVQPNENRAHLNFMSEVEKVSTFTAATNCAIAYVPECVNTKNDDINITLTLVTSTGTATYTIPFQLPNSEELRDRLTRNHIYDLTIQGAQNGLNLRLTVSWDSYSGSTYFDDNITFEANSDPIEWAEGTYYSIDKENKVITLLNDVTLIGEISMLTPASCIWLATLTAVDSEDANNPIVFSDGKTYATGRIDGINKSTLRIKAANSTTTTQHKVSLTFYLQNTDQTTQEISELNGWTIVQTK